MKKILFCKKNSLGSFDHFKLSSFSPTLAASWQLVSSKQVKHFGKLYVKRTHYGKEAWGRKNPWT